MSPDDPSFLQSLLGPNGSLANSLNSPIMGLAMGLLQAGGPSRMPTSFGQAAAQGAQSGQQFQSQGIANAMQRLMLGKTAAQIKWMNSDPSQYGQQNQGTSALTASPQGPVAPTSSDADIGAGLLTQQPINSSQQSTKTQPQQLGINAPVQDGIVSPSQDPTYQYYSRGAQLGLPEAATLAGQRKDIIMGSPEYKAAVERQTALNTPQDLRQGGGIFDPVTHTWIAQLPKLPEGATLDANGNVVMVPGGTTAITSSEKAAAQGGLYGKPATGVITSGPQTGADYQSTVGQLTGGGNGPGAITALPPAQLGGMADAGKAATDRANTAIAHQKDAQQTIAQLGQLQANLDALGTGPGKETQLQVKNALSSVGGFLGFPGLANADLTNAAAARKSIVNLTAPMVRSMGAREPFQMVSFIRDGMASISNPADANAVVMGMLRGVAEYQNDTGKYAGSWLNTNSGAGFAPGKGVWDASWQKQADPGAYIFDNLPAFEQQSILQAAQKNPSLLNEVQRMAKSKKTLQGQGFMVPESQDDGDE